ncbi:hypothetical protein ACFSKU_04115 [Pontibacter silvestris]|uniref:Uncharacterized protein n=1 Tax=Pontibacter silvestris TaxID=2305183 RepID=A0ABW4WW04_9BACT|nr:hypothetical protein [Pontibacter silvestris]MCC9138641.1 hypothetical protein [Pontibacter silvestris]
MGTLGATMSPGAGRRCSENRVPRLMHTRGIDAERKKRFMVPLIPGTACQWQKNSLTGSLLSAGLMKSEPPYHFSLDLGRLAIPGTVLDLFSRKVVGWSM